MQYMGSKRRISKHILPIMLKARLPGMTWVEPFVGGGNTIERVPGKRIGADLNPRVIEALTAIRDHVYELPKNNIEFTETDYRRLREIGDYPFLGYAGFAFSFGGKWLGGWSRDKKGRDYVKIAYNSAVAQHPKLQGVHLVQADYRDLKLPRNCLIYCDPPYRGTTGYLTNFDHSSFWQWCRDRTNEGHIVFISELAAPRDFQCIWQKEIWHNALAADYTKRGIEKLFTYAGIENRLEKEEFDFSDLLCPISVATTER